MLMALASAITVGTAAAAPTTITAYKATIPVNVHGAYSASDWTDTATLNEPSSGATFAVKQNGTGWIFLMIWKTSQFYCSDASCFGGIELGYANNTQPMGSPTTPTIMILASTAFTNNVDEFIATGESTPTSVETLGYTTQSICGLTLTGSASSGTYTVQCYRPFTLKNASPYDFKLGVGSTIEIGFAVGEFDNPGDHSATDMSTYVLTFSGSTYTPTGTSTSTSTSTSSSTSTSTSTSSSSHSTSTSTTTSTSTSKSTSSSSTGTSTSTSASTSTFTSSSTSTSTFISPVTAVSVATTSPSYSGIETGTISGQLTGGTLGFMVTLTITNPAGSLVFANSVETVSNGSFNDTFNPGVNSLWVSGAYTVKASYGTLSSTSTFSYSPATAMTTTTTVVSTVTSPLTITATTSVTGTGITATQTQTQTVTQTSTVTGASSVIPDWVYGVIIALLLLGIALGFMARNLLDANKNRPATRPA